MNVPAVAKPQWEVVGEEFVKAYYYSFENSRESLPQLYSPTAMFTFEEHRAQGQAAIKEILMEKLRFSRIQHVITKVDCQPMTDGGIFILVTGRLKADEDHPHAFSQSFLIQPLNNSYFIFHDIFRLSIHDA